MSRILLSEDNIVAKTKRVGQTFNIIGLLAIIVGIVMAIIGILELVWEDEEFVIIGLGLVGGGALVFIQAVLIYALGQIVANTKK